VRKRPPVRVRNTTEADFPGIVETCRAVYPGSPAWTPEQLASHLAVFPEGQIVAVDEESGQVAGMAASLVVRWYDYDMGGAWRDFTDHGTFRNHDPGRGRTLYGAEIMVHPGMQGRGIGSLLYRARRDLVVGLGLLRIRAGARLRGYHEHAGRMSAEDYARAVIRGEILDPTLTFQIRHGFRVIAVVEGYLRHDPESLGYAAVIEWINPEVACPADTAGRDPSFAKPRRPRTPPGA
jgi:GNAT superfamily N-acetyltransferase